MALESSAQWWTFDRFYPNAKGLRAHFDRRFAYPLRSDPLRFQWDFWHVPGEYTLLRTPAYHYFPPAMYNPFHRFLVEWARERFGCHDISPPWLSCYVEGCRQEAHRDVPHGPLAFVYSLTPWTKRRFTGGETFIRAPKSRIEPLFNRLTVFNPSLTHGVRRVQGTLDPREGRLVIHGWFVNPRAFWRGPLTPDEIHEAVEAGMAPVLRSASGAGSGAFIARLWISANGCVLRTKVLTNTVAGGRRSALDHLSEGIQRLRFPARRRPTVLTLPFLLA